MLHRLVRLAKQQIDNRGREQKDVHSATHDCFVVVDDASMMNRGGNALLRLDQSIFASAIIEAYNLPLTDRIRAILNRVNAGTQHRKVCW